MDTQEARNKGARALLVAASIVIVIAGMKTASSLILPFLVALFLAMVTLPLLNWLQAKRIPTPLAVATTILVALLVLGGIAVVIGGSIKGFTAQAPKYKQNLEQVVSGVQQWLVARGLDVPEELGQSVTGFVKPSQAFDMIAGTLKGVAGVLSNLLLVLLTIIFILFEAAGFPAKLRAAFGRRESSDRFANIRQEVQHYLGIKSLISLTTGSSVAAALAIIGVDFPLLWGMLAFLLNYIPTFGSILAAIPPFLLAIVQLGPGHAVAVALVFVTVNVVLGQFVEPYFMGRRLGLSTLVVFLSLVFWGWVWGPVGMLLSVPLTMIVKIMLENTEDLAWIAVLLGSGPSRETAPIDPPKRPGPPAAIPPAQTSAD
ncbi:MAG: AI-2E family transporter [Planctomycetota bacterium]|jgi:predicted PurR-regulated permease PerM